MKTKDIFTYVMIAAGAYGVYWYITNYGPQGAVNDTTGKPIPGNVSWWNSWFGTSTTAPQVQPPSSPSNQPPATQNQPPATQNQPPATPQTLVVGGVSSDQLLSRAGLPPTGKLNASQWNWYYGQISGVPQNNVYMSDGGQPLTVFDYLNLRVSSGYNTPQSGTLPSSTTNNPPPQSNTVPAATQNQIATIIGLLKQSDVPAFMQMVANGLTSDQANAMIANANSCQSKIPPVPIPGAPQLTVTNYDVNANACSGNPVPISASASGFTPLSGMGNITPVRSVQALTHSPGMGDVKRTGSPWGRLPSSGGGMKWRN